MNTRAPLLIVLVLAGCGGGGGPTDPLTPNNPGTPGNNGTPPNLPTAAAVSFITRLSDDGYGTTTTVNTFSPTNVSIAKGGTVTFTNGTGVQHNVTFATAGGAPQNVPDNTDGSFARTFATAGDFAYSCTNHVGMAGTIHVQ